MIMNILMIIILIFLLVHSLFLFVFILKMYKTKRNKCHFQEEWRKLNKHNLTKLKKQVDITHIIVGKKHMVH